MRFEMATHGICSVDGCDKPKYVRGWCATHYQRWLKNGGSTELRPFVREQRIRETKECARCGSPFYRNKKYSQAQWDSSRWCSRRCGTWNSGLTKHDDARIMAISESVRITAKGRSAWNKGHTKETHPSLAIVAEKVSIAQKGKTINAAQRAGLAVGWGWAAGRTKDDSPGIARMAKANSERLKGVPNPSHSVTLKKLFKEKPHLHPNAVLAKKTKGHGYTHIEKVVAELLRELGLVFDYNVRIGTKWPDFSSPSLKLIFEADGERWHSDAAKEKKRDEYLAGLGWRVVHFPGEMIVSRTAECRAEIIKAVEEAGGVIQPASNAVDQANRATS